MAIRIGCCLNMVAQYKDGVGAERIEEAAEVGFSYVELPLAELMKLPAEQIDNIKNQLLNNGIACEVCNNFFPKNIPLTGANIDCTSIMNYVINSMALASSLGVKHIVFGSGGARNIPYGFSEERGYEQIVSLLRRIAPIARDNGIVIAIEPLRRQECNIINTFAEGCQLSKDVNEANTKVLVDLYHLSAEQEPVENIVKYGHEYLCHVHFACTKERVYPKKTMENTYLPFIHALREIGYDRRISCEAYSSNFKIDAAETLLLFRQIFR